MSEYPTVAVITATLNAASSLPRLVESLRAQTDRNFEWIVADGESTDSTLELLHEAEKDLKLIILSQRDDGIYSALNRAVRAVKSDYYLVAGADDYLAPNAIRDFRRGAQGGVDFVEASIIVDGRAKRKRIKIPWLLGQFAYVRSHAVGLLIRTDLHRSFGFYPSGYRIAADQEFIVRCIRSGASLRSARFTAGEFSTEGASGQNVFIALVEGYQAQLRVGFEPISQSALLAARLIRHRRRILTELFEAPSDSNQAD